MGWIRHHAIVVTSWDDAAITAAHSKAVELGLAVSPVLDATRNSYRSFLIAPDGGKEGWDSSKEGWRRRCEFVAWLREQYDGRGTGAVTSRVDWVEVQFGDDDYQACVTRGSDWDADDGRPDVEEVY